MDTDTPKTFSSHKTTLNPMGRLRKIQWVVQLIKLIFLISKISVLQKVKSVHTTSRQQKKPTNKITWCIPCNTIFRVYSQLQQEPHNKTKHELHEYLQQVKYTLKCISKRNLFKTYSLYRLVYPLMSITVNDCLIYIILFYSFRKSISLEG